MDRMFSKQKMIERLQNKLNRKNNNESQPSGDTESHIEGYDKPTTPFRPFNEASINFDDDQFEDEERDNSSKIDEALLAKFMNNLLTNQALSLADKTDYNEKFDGNTIFGQDQIANILKITPVPEETSIKFDRTPKKKTRTARQGRTKKAQKKEDDEEEEDSEESIMSDFPPGSTLNIMDNALMINIPVDMFRQYLSNELEQKLWFVNLHYRREWETINRERIITLAELVKIQESSRKLKKQHEEMRQTLKIYKDKFGEIDIPLKQDETNGASKKEGKRRRRQAKKQRKTDQMPTSQSDFVSGESDRDLDQGQRAKSQDSDGDD